MANTGHSVDANTVALWRMDETAHTDYITAAEANSNYDATQATASLRPSIAGGPGGVTDYARWFRGTANVHMDFAMDSSLVSALIGDWTWEGWIYVEEIGATQAVISIGGPTDSEADNFLAHITVTTGGKLSCFWESGAGVNRSVTQVTGSTLTERTWHYVAVTSTVSGGSRTVAFFIDSGTEQDSGSATNATGGGSATARFGIDVNNTADYHGAMSISRISTIVRSTSELNASAASTAWANDANTIALWDFQEAPELKDISGSGFHAHARDYTASPARIVDPLIVDGGQARSSIASTERYTVFDREDLRSLFVGEWSVELWMRIQTAAVTHQVLEWAGPSDSEADNFLARVQLLASAGDYNADFFAETGAGTNVGGTGSVNILSDNVEGATNAQQLRHLAYTFEDAGGSTTLCRVYIDGLEVDTIGPYTTPTGGTNPALTGNGLSLFDVFDGDVDDMRLSDKARSAAEVLASFEAGEPTVCPPPSSPSSPILPAGAIPTATPAGQLYDGDALFFPTADGGDLLFTAGDPTRSGGLRNASYLSMFGANDDDTGLPNDKKSWWGNHIEVDPNRQYRGQTGRLLNTLPLVTANLPVIAAAVEDDHAWMLETGLATSVSAEAAIIGHNKIEITVAIDAIGDQSEFVFIENWKAGS